MTDPWRLRCPEGHADLRHPVSKDGYYCKRCEELYPGEPIDAKHVDGFPVEVPDASAGWKAETVHQHATDGRGHR